MPYWRSAMGHTVSAQRTTVLGYHARGLRRASSHPIPKCGTTTSCYEMCSVARGTRKEQHTQFGGEGHERRETSFMISSMMMIGNDTLRMCFHSSCGCVCKTLDPINTQPRRGTRQAAHLAHALAHRTPATPKLRTRGYRSRTGQVHRGQAQVLPA